MELKIPWFGLGVHKSKEGSEVENAVLATFDTGVLIQLLCTSIKARVGTTIIETPETPTFDMPFSIPQIPNNTQWVTEKI